jgi:hypothetical protein
MFISAGTPGKVKDIQVKVAAARKVFWSSRRERVD